MSVLVTGVGLALPGIDSVADLLGAAHRPDGEVDPKVRLGRKGLRYKDRATQLGLCVAKDALTDAGLLTADGLTVDGDSVAVVVSSNLGNLDTVCRVVRTIADETTHGVSPMDTPNASSNIIASEVAIKFGLRGPNLMVCNGATSGLDAVHWAITMLRSGRASQVLVLGVEPDSDPARQLLGADRIVDGGAALILERAETAASRAVPAKAGLGRYVRTAGVAGCLGRLADSELAAPGAWFVPEQPPGSAALPAPLLETVPRRDLSQVWGATSGALGVMQCAAAIGWFAAGGVGPVYAVAGSDGDDASAGLVLHGPQESR